MAQLDETLRYKPGQVSIPNGSLEFFIDLFLPAAIGAWGQLSL